MHQHEHFVEYYSIEYLIFNDSKLNIIYKHYSILSYITIIIII